LTRRAGSGVIPFGLVDFGSVVDRFTHIGNCSTVASSSHTRDAALSEAPRRGAGRGAGGRGRGRGRGRTTRRKRKKMKKTVTKEIRKEIRKRLTGR
jgi:hypothetical protein